MIEEAMAGGSESAVKRVKLGKTRVGLAIVLCPVLLLTVIAATSIRFVGGRILDKNAFSSYANSAVGVPEVTDAVGSAASDKVLDLVDPEGRLSEKKRQAIKDAIADSMSSDVAKRLAVSTFSRAHDEFISLAERDDLTGAETFKVDLLPLVYVGMADLSQKKLIPAAVSPLDESTTDSKSLAKTLSQALGRKVTATAGTVKVIEQKEDGSKTAITQVHDVLSAYHNGVMAATAVALVLVLAVVFLFARRRVGVIVGSSVILLATFVPWIALAQVPARVAEAIDDEKGSAIAKAFLTPLAGDVRTRLLLVLVPAVLAILLASFWSRIPTMKAGKSD